MGKFWGMEPPAIARYCVRLVLLMLGYAAVGYLSLLTLEVDFRSLLVWPAAGVAMAGLLRWGLRLWPACGLGAFLLALSAFRDPAIAAGLGLGTALGCGGAAYVLRRLRFRRSLERRRDFVQYLAAVCGGMAVVSGVGVATLHAAGRMAESEVAIGWLLWWIGNVLGALLAGVPLLSSSLSAWKAAFRGWRGLYNVAAFAGVPLSVLLFYRGGLPEWAMAPSTVLPMLLLIVLALRAGLAVASTAVCIAGATALWCVLSRGDVQQHDIVGVWSSTARLAMVAYLVSAMTAELASDARRRLLTQEALRRQLRLGAAIRRVQSHFIGHGDARATFEDLLRELLGCGGSEYGFIAEVLRDEHQQPYLKTVALTNIAWSDETRALYERWQAEGLEFRNLQTLFGAALLSGEPVFANHPSSDPRSGGIPPGHPPLDAFLGVPLYAAGQLVGMVGIANRTGGYDRALLQFLQPLLACTAGLIAAVRGERRRAAAEREVKQSHEVLHKLAGQVPGVLFRCCLQRDGRFTDAYVSPGVEQLFGRLPASTAETIELVRGDMDPTDRERVERGMMAAGAAGVHWRDEYRLLRADSAPRWHEIQGTPERRADGSVMWYGYIYDVTERKRNELALSRQLARNRTLFDNAIDCVMVLDGNGRVMEANGRLMGLLGYSMEEVVGLDTRRWDAQLDATRAREIMLQLKHKGGAIVDTVYRHKQGELIPVEASLSLAMWEDQPLIFCVVRDIRERKAVENRLRLLANVFNHSHSGIMITDAQNRIVEVNGAFTLLTGYSRDEVLGGSPSLLQSGRHDRAFYTEMWRDLQHAGHWRGEVWNRRKTGELYAELLTISVVRLPGGEVSHYVGQFSDITQLKEQQARLEQMAHYDSLTQLPNRVLLADRLQQAMALARREELLLAVCYMDLDGFKAVNDSLGHAAGDRLLIAVAERLREQLRGNDTMARLGGDEFVVLLGGMDSIEQVEEALNRLLAAVAEPYVVAGASTTVSASIGVALFPSDDCDADSLLRHADQAMYQAKQGGRNRYHLFNAELDRRARRFQELRADIETAMAAGELRLHYQPQVELSSGRVVGAEALLRWKRPGGKLMLPGEFLPVVENTDIGLRLGYWVIEQAMAQAAAWACSGLPLTVSVNLSARQLQQEAFAESVKLLLARYPEIDPSQIEFEVVETAALDDLHSAGRAMEDCRRLGVSFAIDDFGTGYSSLSYLKRLPAEALKIDQSFVRDMLRDADDLAIVKGVIGLAAAFRRRVIAEGVESAQHARLLLALGCEYAQGHGIAPAMPAEDIAAWVAAYEARPLLSVAEAAVAEPRVPLAS